jgi:hypothetical protein
MSNYSQVNFTLTDNQIAKIRSGKANDVPVTLQISRTQHSGPHPLFLTKSQIKKLRTGNSRITLSKTQLRAQTGGFLGPLISAAVKFIPKLLPHLGTLGIHALGGVASELGRKAIKGRGITRAGQGRGITRAGQGFTLRVPNEDIELMLGVCKCMEDQGELNPGTTETVKQHIQSQSGGFIGTLIASLASAVLPSLIGKIVKAVKGRGLTRAGDFFLDP